MATSRIFFQNFLTSASVVSTIVTTGGAGAQAPALVSGVIPVKSGSATLLPSGTYTSLIEKSYYVQASIGGTFATTRLQWSDTSLTGPWNATNITPVSGTPISLNSGVSVTLTAGPTAPQFVAGDTWIFRVALRYGVAKALDGSRNSEWRSGAMPVSSTLEWRFDLGSVLTPSVVSLLDVNAPSLSTTQLFNTASNFTTINSTTTIPWNASKMIALVSGGSSRYWVLRVTMPASQSLTYLRWSEIFLGSIALFTRTFIRGFRRERRPLGTEDVEGTLQHGPGPLLLEADYWVVRYEYLDTTDQAMLTALRNWIQDQTYRVKRPFYWIATDNNLMDFELVHWVNPYVRENASNTADNDRVHAPMELAEVVRSIA